MAMLELRHVAACVYKQTLRRSRLVVRPADRRVAYATCGTLVFVHIVYNDK
jgi:hypothetical protein